MHTQNILYPVLQGKYLHSVFYFNQKIRKNIRLILKEFSYLQDKNLVKEGASDPWRDITIGFAPYEAGQVVKALNCMAADNPAIDFCMEEEDDE